MRWIKKDIEPNREDGQADNDYRHRIEEYKYVLDSINTWIASADNKVSIFCGMYSVVVAVVAFVAKHLMPALISTDEVVNNVAYHWFIGCVAFAAGGFIVSIVFYTWSVKPNLIGKKNKDKKMQLSIYYKDIAELANPEDLINLVTGSYGDAYFNSLISEIYYNSKVCTRKMQNFQVAVIASAVTIILSIAATVAYYFSYTGNLIQP